MLLVIGLGNPGKKFADTWHNLGFLVVDEVAQKHGFPDWRLDKKSHSLITEILVTEDGPLRVLLVKPQTFMNDSGKTVAALIKNYKLKTTNLIVVHDDADLAVGKIRISRNRGAGGHKGVESIIKELKTKNFTRIRLGCRPKNYLPGSKTLDRFVLKKFSRNEPELVDKIINQAVSSLDSLVLGET
jgi:PTH1 family peptidyl-tRNA hydrolase